MDFVKETVQIHNSFKGFDGEDDEFGDSSQRYGDIGSLGLGQEGAQGALSEAEVAERLREQESEIAELEARIQEKESTISSFNKTQDGYLSKLQERVQQLEGQLQIEKTVSTKFTTESITAELDGLNAEQRREKIEQLEERLSEERFKKLAMKVRNQRLTSKIEEFTNISVV